MSFWNSIASLLTAALSLLGFAQANPTLPQTQHDQIVQSAQQAITTATNAIASSSAQISTSGELSASPTSGASPLTVTFSVPAGPSPSPGEAMHGGTYYFLNFGDGQSIPTDNTEGEAFSTAHTYAKPGVYTATLVSPSARGGANDGTTVGSITITVTLNSANLSNPNMSAGDACGLFAESKLGDTNASVGGDGKRITEMQTLLGVTPATGYYGPKTQIAYTNTCIGGNAQPTSVSGMSKYTDSDFGFSFWYPNGWMVQQVSVADQNVYVGGTLQKELMITSNISSYGYSNSILIDEFTSPGSTIDDPASYCSNGGDEAGACGDIRYYFDTNTSTWMWENPAHTAYSGKDGSAYTIATTTQIADVSQNTMGGLHMLSQANEHHRDVIVPLSAQNFVIVESSVSGASNSALAQTIVATDPSVATPESTAQQTATIQAEASAYTNAQ